MKKEKLKKLIIMVDDDLYQKLRYLQKQKNPNLCEVGLFSRMVGKSYKNGTLKVVWK